MSGTPWNKEPRPDPPQLRKENVFPPLNRVYSGSVVVSVHLVQLAGPAHAQAPGAAAGAGTSATSGRGYALYPAELCILPVQPDAPLKQLQGSIRSILDKEHGTKDKQFSLVVLTDRKGHPAQWLLGLVPLEMEKSTRHALHQQCPGNDSNGGKRWQLRPHDSTNERLAVFVQLEEELIQLVPVTARGVRILAGAHFSDNH